jgi:hypothetical protein
VLGVWTEDLALCHCTTFLSWANTFHLLYRFCIWCKLVSYPKVGKMYSIASRAWCYVSEAPSYLRDWDRGDQDQLGQRRRPHFKKSKIWLHSCNFFFKLVVHIELNFSRCEIKFWFGFSSLFYFDSIVYLSLKSNVLNLNSVFFFPY